MFEIIFYHEDHEGREVLILKRNQKSMKFY
jgi:hypothetical protein